MGKFTNFVLNQGTPELTADQSAALAAADQALKGTGQATTGSQTVQWEPGPETPTQAIQQRVPFADVQPAQGDLEGVARVREQAEQGKLVTPAPETEAGVRFQTPDEAEADYRKQISAEQTRRESVDLGQSTFSLPINPETKPVKVIADNISKMEMAFSGYEGVIAPGTEKSDAMQGFKALGLTQGYVNPKSGAVSDKKSVPRQGAGGAAYLATIAALNRLTEQQSKFKAKDEGGVQEEGWRKGEIDKYTLINSIATELESLTQPPTTLTETGEATGRGMGGRLTSDQKQNMGDMILRAGSEVGIFGDPDGSAPEGALMTLVNPKDGSGVPVYSLTEEGMKFLQSVSPMLKELMPGAVRPVSFTPQPNGTYVGEAATRQTEITRVPDPRASRITNTMKKAMDIMGTTPNIVSPHKLKMTDMMHRYAVEMDQQGQSTVFSGMLGIGRGRVDKLAKESVEANQQTFEVVWDKEREAFINTRSDSPMNWDFDGVNEQEIIKSEFPNNMDGQPFEYVRQYKSKSGKEHNVHAQNVVDMQAKKVADTIQEARAASGKSFYYGATVIGNSGRLMYSQTELNLQGNKLARFMIDNPRPSTINLQGGKSLDVFKYVVARSMIEGADTMTRHQLEKTFEEKRGLIDGIAKEVYRATEADDAAALNAALTQAKADAGDGKTFMDEWGSTDEWGFIVDGLHEWGKYLSILEADPKAKQMQTRIKVEVDGINNGSSIQGLQFGDKTILERAGVIFDVSSPTVLKAHKDPEGNIIGQNMRDYVFGVGVFVDPTVSNLQVKEDALRDVGEKDGIRDIIASKLPVIYENSKWRKKFIKIPLMTTIYGKGAGGHADAVEDFIKDKMSELGITNKNRRAMVDGYAKVIRNAIQDTLNDPLVHQDMVKKQASWFFTVMNIVPQVKGANDYIVQSGGYDRVDDVYGPGPKEGRKKRMAYEVYRLEGGKRGEKWTPTGQLKKREPSATSRKELSKEAKKRGTEPEAWGEHTRNQLAVNGTHNIDATIAQETLIAVKQEMGDTFWGHQVFDAFIGDVSSIEKLIDQGNKKFLSVNRDYNMIEAELDAFDDAIKRFDIKMRELDQDAKTLDVTDAGTYRGVKAFVDNFLKTGGKGEAHNKHRWVDGVQGFESFLRNAGFKLEKAKGKDKEGKEKTARDWSLADKKVSPKQVRELINYMQSNFLSPPTTAVVQDQKGNYHIDESEDRRGKPIRASFKDNIARTKQAKDNFYKNYRDMLGNVRQFN